MTNEKTTEDVFVVTNLKDKVRQLPWKKIAMGTAAVAVGVLVVRNREALFGPQTFEVTSIETLEDGSSVVTAVPKKN